MLLSEQPLRNLVARICLRCDNSLRMSRNNANSMLYGVLDVGGHCLCAWVYDKFSWIKTGLVGPLSVSGLSLMRVAARGK